MKNFRKITLAAMLAALLFSVSVIISGCSLYSPEPPAVPTSSTTPSGTIDYEYITGPDTVTLIKYIGAKQNVVIPTMINGLTVTTISDYCFSDSFTSISTIYIPASVTSIGDYAFYNINTLSSVTFESTSTLKKIGKMAFHSTPFIAQLLADNNGIASIGPFLLSAEVSGVFTVPSNILYFAEGSLMNDAISNIVLHENISVADVSVINEATCLEYITIPSISTNFSTSARFFSETICIRCTKGSLAESYAIRNNMFYEYISEADAWKYVIDGDNAIITGYSGSSFNVKFPSSIESHSVAALGNGKKIDCTVNIKKVLIPSTVETIADYFFNGVTELESVILRENFALQYIGENAFRDTLYENNTQTRPGYAILGNILIRHFGIGDVTVPDGISGIASGAFSSGATSIIINEDCLWIGTHILADCTELAWIQIPNSITHLEVETFEKLPDLQISCDAVSYAAKFAQENSLNCEALYYWDFTVNEDDNTVTLVQYTGVQKYVQIPSYIDQYKVTVLGSIMNTSIESIVIPATITHIESMFAYAVTTLKTVTFEDPYALQYIGSHAFKDTPYEKNALDSNNMLIIGDILASHANIPSAVIPNGVKIISSMVFAECDNLISVILPESCIRIDPMAFVNCPMLEKVYIPDSVIEIGDYILNGSEQAYISCHSNSFAESYAKRSNYKRLTVDYSDWTYTIESDKVILNKYTGASLNVVIPRTIHGKPVTVIGSRCFFGASVVSVFIPDSITKIQEGAFASVTSLKSVTFENERSIEEISFSAFVDTEYFNEKIKASDLFIINKTLLYCDAVGTVTLPDHVRIIAKGAFSSADTTYVIINQGCHTIADGAFSATSGVKTLFIPASVTVISSLSFSSTQNDLKIHCYENSAAMQFAQINGYAYETVKNEYTYKTYKNDNGTTVAELTKYTGSATSIIIPTKIDGYTVESIGTGCFAGKSVISLYVPSTVRKIGSGIATAVLTNVSFEDESRIDFVADGAFTGTVFENKTNMNSNGLCIVGNTLTKSTSKGALVLPNGIKAISSNAFKGVVALTSITIPESCVSIGDSAFANTSSLEWVYIPTSVVNIGKSILSGAKAAIRCNAGSTAEAYADKNNYNYILMNADTLKWEYTFSNNQITLVRYIGEDLKVNIPNKIGSFTVTAIGNRCFLDSQITSVVIPASITYIGYEAFCGTTALTSVKFEDVSTIEYVGYNAFAQCSAESSFFDKDGFALINNVLIGCKASGNVVLKNNVTQITGYAFMNNTKITTLSISQNCTYIGENAFFGCTSLEWIFIPDSVNAIEKNIFSDGMTTYIRCHKNSYAEQYAKNNGYNYEYVNYDFLYTVENSQVVITDYIGSDLEVVIPSKIDNMPVVALGEKAFADSNITSITIPASITKIGNMCFANTASLVTVNFEDITKLKHIGSGAFRSTAYENVTLVNDNNLAILNNILIRSFASGNVELKAGITEIASEAFFDRQDVVSVTINDGCKIIRTNAFSEMYNLERVFIPSSVTTIEDDLFVNCSSAITIHCYAGSAAESFAIANSIPYVIINQ